MGGSDQFDKNLSELSRLIDLYRNFFGSGQKASSNQSANTAVVKAALSQISAQMSKESQKQ